MSTFRKERKACTKIHWTFQNVDRIGVVFYRLELPNSLVDVHNVFSCVDVDEALVRRGTTTCN